MCALPCISCSAANPPSSNQSPQHHPVTAEDVFAQPGLVGIDFASTSETTSNQHDLTSNCKEEPMVTSHFGQQRDGIDQQNMLTASTNVMCKQATSYSVVTSAHNFHLSREASGVLASDGASSAPPRRQGSSDMQFGSGSWHSQVSAQHPQSTAADCRFQLELHQGSDAPDSNVTPLRYKNPHQGGHVLGQQSYRHSSSSPLNSKGQAQQAQHEDVSLSPAR